MSRCLLIALAAGCAGDVGNAGDPDAGGSDAPTGCSVFVTFDPMMAIAGPSTEIRAIANVSGAPGVLAYQWEVKRSGTDVAFANAQADGSAITFFAPVAGPYDVMVAIGGSSAFCPTAQRTINVAVEGGNLEQVRMRVYPPLGIEAPPSERLVLVTGGADFSMMNVPIDPGVEANGHVRMGTQGVASYLRFIPLGAREAYVEGFAATDGAFRVRMLNQLHDVLVVPMVAGIAPRLALGWTPGTPLISVDAGVQISGVVRDPSGTGIANTHVQVTLDGVPSTLATTNASGQFTVRASAPQGVPDVGVEVTPPMASGLPRIAGSATSISIASSITVQYNANLLRRDLGGTVVRRNNVAQPNAPVKIVGTIGAVATINTTVNANGEVRISTTANGSGAIPNGTLAPAAPLFAVSSIGSQLAVDAIDLTTAVPASIDAPSAANVLTEARNPAGMIIQGAYIDLIPAGPLALANAPIIRGTSDGNGNVTLAVPVGGTWDVRVSDPQARGAPHYALDVPTASIANAYALNDPLVITGALVLSGNASPIGRAAVQLLCTACSGAARSRPLAEGTTTSAGNFGVAIADPGVN